MVSFVNLQIVITNIFFKFILVYFCSHYIYSYKQKFLSQLFMLHTFRKRFQPCFLSYYIFFFKGAINDSLLSKSMCVSYKFLVSLYLEKLVLPDRCQDRCWFKLILKNNKCMEEEVQKYLWDTPLWNFNAHKNELLLDELQEDSEQWYVKRITQRNA